MKPYRLYVLDLDGTLYRGDEVLPGAVETVAQLRRRGASLRFLTNNSSTTPERVAAKLLSMGYQCDAAEVHTSATGTAQWLAENGMRDVFVVGEPGLAVCLERRGIRVLNFDGAMLKETSEAILNAVVVGICRQITYRWIDSAMQQLFRGAAFVATNADATYPLDSGRLEPGGGSMVAAIEACSKVQPVIIGKPNPYMIDLILAEAGVAAQDTLVVGDRPETDLESGRRAGCDTHLVLTGVTDHAPEGQSWSHDLRALL